MPKTIQTQTPSIVVYRCTRGHQWQSERPAAQNLMSVSVGIAGDLRDLCPHCFYDFLKKFLTANNIGKVEIVND